MTSELTLKREKVRLLEQQLELREGLPHTHSFKRYGWQQEFCDSKFTHRDRLLCAANQIGKSTIQICDRIEVAGKPELWPTLWPDAFKLNPRTVPYSWYLYPNQDTVMAEFEEKWVPYFLPRGKFESHPIWGWTKHVQNKVLKYIRFNSGWTIYFKTYNQNVSDLQSGTVFAVDCDEELPVHLLSELQARMINTNGYFSMVFTATLGQEHWRKAVEATPSEIESGQEVMPGAWKRQVSLYDCKYYADGEETIWTDRRIEGAITRCKDKREIRRRINGKFVKTEGLKYMGFDRDRNYRPYPKQKDGTYYKGVPKGWSVYSACDYGSGGETGHPSAFWFLSVSPNFTKIRAFRGRRMDGIKTTAGDLWAAYKKSRGRLQVTAQAYDGAAADFGTITSRIGESFNKAKKSHDVGELALNTALSTGMLVIYYDPTDEEDESHKLVGEFESLLESTPKRIAKDDAIDAVRYALMEIPIDWEAILEGVEEKAPEVAKDGSPEAERERDYWRSAKDQKEDIEIYDAEFEEWNSYME